MPAILCPRCHKLISSDAPQCIFCGQRRPGMWGLTGVLARWRARVDFSRLIVGVCVGLYLLALISDPGAIFRPQGMMGLLAPSDRASFRFGMTGSVPIFGLGHWWTVITAVYLHGGLLHIFFNMMWIRQLGPLVEELYGPLRLFVIFTVAGAVGFLLSAYMGHPYTLGASGSIFGLLAAAIAYGRRAGSSLFTRQFLQWAAVMFIFGLVFPGVDNWAHAGGFVGGYGTAFVFARRQRQEGLGSYLGAAICVVVTLGAFFLQVRAVLGLPF
jgi:rhomboid protease GluP